MFCFAKCCRVCVSKKEILIDINKLDGDELIIEKLQFCLPGSDFTDTTLPAVICSACSVDLEHAYNFMKRCKNGQEILLRYKRCLTRNTLCYNDENSESLVDMEVANDDLLVPKEENLFESEITTEDDLTYNETSLGDNDGFFEQNLNSYMYIKNDYDNSCIEPEPGVAEENEMTSLNESQSDSDASCFDSDSDPEFDPKKYDMSIMCKYCSYKFISKYALHKHVSLNLCAKKVRLEKLYREMISEGLSDNLYKCKICDLAFNNRKTLKRHLRRNCKISVRKVYNKKKWTQRKKSKTETKIIKVEPEMRCDLCHINFSSQFEFKQHSAIHKVIEESVPKMTCELCNITYAELEYYEKHMSRKHSAQDDPGGGAANKRKRSLVGLPRIHKCPLCPMTYKRRSQVKLHMIKHSTERPFPCDTCGKAFKSALSLRKHETTVHVKNKPYICDVCHKAFAKNFSVQLHKKKHLEKFPCQHCDKKYRDLERLENHVKIHRQLKPNTCEICLRQFKVYAEFQRHRKTGCFAAAAGNTDEIIDPR